MGCWCLAEELGELEEPVDLEGSRKRPSSWEGAAGRLSRLRMRPDRSGRGWPGLGRSWAGRAGAGRRARMGKEAAAEAEARNSLDPGSLKSF